MKVISMLTAALLLGACAARGEDPATIERELRAANETYDRGLVDGDAAVLDRFYTSDFTIIDDDAAIHGKQGQIQFMTREVDLLEARSDDVRVTILGPDAAMLTGRFAGRYRYKGAENAFTERYTSIWVRDDDQWRVRHEHTSLLPKPETADSN